jgi:hypothetical protein
MENKELLMCLQAISVFREPKKITIPKDPKTIKQ